MDNMFNSQTLKYFTSSFRFKSLEYSVSTHPVSRDIIETMKHYDHVHITEIINNFKTKAARIKLE